MEHVYVIDCPEHSDCWAVCCEATMEIQDEDGKPLHKAGAVVWVSHAPKSVDVEPRLAPEHGNVEDYRAD